MAKINHPLFGSLGAFWIDGNETPFYSLHDAKQFQQKNGGDILHWDGKMLYPEPPPPIESTPEPVPETRATASMGIQSSGNWLTRLFSKA